jgi:hypothetical protein
MNVEKRNSKKELHSDDGPAVITDDYQWWMKNGEFDREDGLPTIEYKNGNKVWHKIRSAKAISGKVRVVYKKMSFTKNGETFYRYERISFGKKFRKLFPEGVEIEEEMFENA